VTALDQLLSPQLVYIDYDGSIVSKQEFLAAARAPDLHPEQITNEQQSAHGFGNCAVVVYRETGVYKGKPYTRRGRFTDTWVKLNITWQCVASQFTLIQQ